MRFPPSLAIAAALLIAASWARADDSGGPWYRGRVVDAQTKQPLAATVVLVYWNVLAVAPGHPERFWHAEEVVTGARGEFAIRARPPRAPAPGTRISRPYVSILKPGWAPFPYGQSSPVLAPRGLDAVLATMRQMPVGIELPRLTTRAGGARLLDS